MISKLYKAALDTIFKDGSAAKIEYPHSDVFYVREAINSLAPSNAFTVEQVESAMRAEGWRD